MEQKTKEIIGLSFAFVIVVGLSIWALVKAYNVSGEKGEKGEKGDKGEAFAPATGNLNVYVRQNVESIFVFNEASNLSGGISSTLGGFSELTIGEAGNYSVTISVNWKVDPDITTNVMAAAEVFLNEDATGQFALADLTSSPDASGGFLAQTQNASSTRTWTLPAGSRLSVRNPLANQYVVLPGTTFSVTRVG